MGRAQRGVPPSRPRVIVLYPMVWFSTPSHINFRNQVAILCNRRGEWNRVYVGRTNRCDSYSQAFLIWKLYQGEPFGIHKQYAWVRYSNGKFPITVHNEAELLTLRFREDGL